MPRPSNIILREHPQHLLQRRLDECQSQSGWVKRTEAPLAPPGFKAWIIQSVASHYTDYITLAPKDPPGEKEVNDSLHYVTRNCDTHVDSVALLRLRIQGANNSQLYSRACYNEWCYNEQCYNEQFLSIKSGYYNECGGILLADIARVCAWHVRPSCFH
jgi:hypothetical protein